MKILKAIVGVLEKILPQSLMENYIYGYMLKIMIYYKKFQLKKMKFHMKQKKIKYEVRKGKVGRHDLYVFPGRKIGDLLFPAYCVLLTVNRCLKFEDEAERAFIAVMN